MTRERIWAHLLQNTDLSFEEILLMTDREKELRLLAPEEGPRRGADGRRVLSPMESFINRRRLAGVSYEDALAQWRRAFGEGDGT